MNKAMMTAAVIALAVGLAGCGKKDAQPPADTATADTATTPAAPVAAAIPIDPAKPNACNKLTDVKLAATIDAATKTLKISGTAKAPQAGYATALQAGPLDKMNPPTQIVLLRANAPEPGAEVVTDVALSVDIANAQPAYKSIRVVCPGVPDVELTVG
ncbi:hypothetical protein [Sphingopyxis sp. PET50]|uniref:hypothetical protein n=1 Tax=Sphingopyxis sp. PET50 TaxID=2976533 RepID=UPI0021AF167D|nr:hypothetical protein [Sphingopyxis sp. PET50]